MSTLQLLKYRSPPPISPWARAASLLVFFIKFYPGKRVPVNNSHNAYPKVRKPTDLKKNKVDLVEGWHGRPFLTTHSSHIHQILYGLLSWYALFPFPCSFFTLSFRETCLFFQACGLDCSYFPTQSPVSYNRRRFYFLSRLNGQWNGKSLLGRISREVP